MRYITDCLSLKETMQYIKRGVSQIFSLDPHFIKIHILLSLESIHFSTQSVQYLGKLVFHREFEDTCTRTGITVV